jgi:protoheme IX farnesyltransferase
MPIWEAVLFSVVTGLLGLAVLYWAFAPLTAIMGFASILLYSFVYTPLKKWGWIAVLVGAVPGAMPAIIGYVAATKGDFDLTGGMLFALQFFWQLPHFWAIAWLAFDDYKNGGFSLLPFNLSKNRHSAVWIAVSGILMLVSALPLQFGLVSAFAGILLVLFSLLYAVPALVLVRTLDRKAALLLMFASFAYLPAVFITFWLGKIG